MIGNRAYLATMAAGGIGALVIAAGVGQRPAAAATTVPAQAEADAYGVQAQAFLLGNNLSTTPIQVGPVAATTAVVPPGTTTTSNLGLVQFDSHGQQPLLDYANVISSNSKATLVPQSSTSCAVPKQALTSGFIQSPLTGASGCVDIAQAGLLNTGSADSPSDQVQAAAVEAQSITQSCTATPQGFVNIARLSIGGQDVIGGSSPLLGTNTPGPNTVVPLIVGYVVLNEQHFDNHGHGLLVNAIHIYTAAELGALVSANIVIGHAHSEAFCESGTTETGGGPNPGSDTSPVPVVTKLDSTKHANPGEIVTYSITVDTKGCNVTRVTDILPPGFIFKSASGGLGAPTSVGPSAVSPGQTQVDFHNPSGFSATNGMLTETIVVQVPTNAANGLYINNVNGQSAPPIGSTSGCGEFQGSDNLPVSSAPPGAPPGTTGTNPGVIVPRPGETATPTPSAGATPTATPTASTGAVTSIPNTSATGAPGASALGGALVIFLGLSGIAGTSLIVRRRRKL